MAIALNLRHQGGIIKRPDVEKVKGSTGKGAKSYQVKSHSESNTSERAKPEQSGDAKPRVQIKDRRAAEENASDVSAF